MGNKSYKKKDKLKNYSSIYRKSKFKNNKFKRLLRYIFVFFIVFAVTYIACVIIYSFITRQHKHEVFVPDDYKRQGHVEDKSSEKTKKDKNIDESKHIEEDSHNIYIDTKISAVELPKRYIFSESALKSFIKTAKTKDKDSIVVLLKDEAGKILYNSEVELVKKWNTKADNAVDARKIVKYITDGGLIPIAKLNAFLDGTAPHEERDNSFLQTKNDKVKKDKLYLFKDGEDKTLKKWLNPASKVSRKYILDLVQELKNIGFKYVLLENLRFADCEFTEDIEDYENIDKKKLLKYFIKKLQNIGIGCIISYNIENLLDKDSCENCFGGDISKYDIYLQSIVVDKNENLDRYINVIRNLKNKRKNVVFIPKVELKKGSGEFLNQLQSFNIDSSIVVG